ncbi:MAG: helix-turn-helix domain-containing protein [Dysgonomonas sp.]
MNINTANALIESYKTCTDEVSASVEIWKLEQNQRLEFIADEHKILFVTSGCFKCSLQGYTDQHIGSHQMVFISMSSRCRISTESGVSIICMQPGAILDLSDYSVYNQIQDTDSLKLDDKPLVLKFTPLMMSYVVSMKWFLQLGFKNSLHAQLKVREFFHLMSTSYSLAERIQFFHTLVFSERKFSDFIYKNYRRVASIRELAVLSCYSLSGFEKRFRKVFGVTASHWIALRKAADINQEIRNNQKTIKQISFEYGFSSVSHFHKFCKAKLGLSPGYMRKQAQNQEMIEKWAN